MTRQQRRLIDRNGGDRKPTKRQPRNGSIATGNRHGGPHLHKREIARRERQSA